MSELGLSAGTLSKLESEHIETLGQLDEFWKSGKLLTDIKGIGEETAAKIADAYADYGQQHPALFGQESDAPAEEVEA